MEISNTTEAPNLSPIILWQYDQAVNLQRLIWHKENVIVGEDGAETEVQQTGLAQRISENAKFFYDDFFTYGFDAVNLAIREDMDALPDDDIRKRKVAFGLSLWSSLMGIARPQYTESVTNKVKDVRLRTWARYIKATFFKFRMNGSLYDLNRYMKILMPELKIDIIDGGLAGDWNQSDKMTLTYAFNSGDGIVTTVGFRFPSYVRNGATVSLSLVFTMTVNTTENKFSLISVVPYLEVKGGEGIETRYVGVSAYCHDFTNPAWYGIADIRQLLPPDARTYMAYKQMKVVTVGEETELYFTEVDEAGEEVDLPVGPCYFDSKVAPVMDQNGNTVGYEFTDEANPLMGLPNWQTYIGREYPEYSEMLKIRDILPYPAGVNDGNSEMQIKPADGRYLGIVDTDERKWTEQKNWAKYTLDNSILYPEEYENPPSFDDKNADRFFITFDTDGGTAVQMQIVKSGGYATRPSQNPKKNGAVFTNWYTSSAYATVFDFTTTQITQDTVIYAKFV